MPTQDDSPSTSEPASLIRITSIEGASENAQKLLVQQQGRLKTLLSDVHQSSARVDELTANVSELQETLATLYSSHTMTYAAKGVFNHFDHISESINANANTIDSALDPL